MTFSIISWFESVPTLLACVLCEITKPSDTLLQALTMKRPSNNLQPITPYVVPVMGVVRACVLVDVVP